MDGKDSEQLLGLFHAYVSLEEKITQRVSETAKPVCAECRETCCEEIICRESLHSTFLNRIIGFQDVQYDPEDGWMSAQGCRLGSGKPLVCHEFFCEDILKRFSSKAASIRELVSDFAGIGNKAYGNTHLLCIDDLETISGKKLFKMKSRIEHLMAKLTDSDPG